MFIKLYIMNLCSIIFLYLGLSVHGNVNDWVTNGKHYYYVSDGTKVNWQTARTSCHQMSADLLSIADQTEQEYIESIIQNDGYSIGLKNDEGQDSTIEDWYWVDNTDHAPGVWHNWEPGHPDSTDLKTCARLLNTGLWRTQECNSQQGGYQYICKRPDPCSNDQCENGDCIPVNEGTSYYCKCHLGFTGSNCETDIDDCSANPCQHDGKCLDAVNSYTCDCTGIGYEGHHCEIDIDECVTGALKCLNSGTCVNTNGSAYCDCIPGYTGAACETDIDECKSNSCQNEGRCIDAINSYLCDCTGTGFQGQNCQDDINECTVPGELECLNGGTCINTPGSAHCECLPGFTGETCETDIDECSSHPCTNGGRCTDDINSYYCDCTGTGYQGDHCEIDINECAGELVCLNGGTCVNTPGSAYCDCKPGYSGVTCQTDIDECSSNPCQNGGVCIDAINSYHCDCTDTGFEGEHCQTDINECETVKPECMHNSTCINTPGSAYCDCVNGTTGKYCETDIDECMSTPCVNGQCIDDVGGFACDCISGYQGVVCEIDIDECYQQTHECVNGTCVNIEGSYWCNCTDGFFGTICNETSFFDTEEGEDLYALKVAFYTSLAICIAINSSFAAVVIYYYVTDRREKTENEELAEYCNVQRRPEQN